MTEEQHKVSLIFQIHHTLKKIATTMRMRRLLRMGLAAVLACRTAKAFSIQQRMHSMSVGNPFLRSRSRKAVDNRNKHQPSMAATIESSQLINNSNDNEGIKGTLTIVLENLPLQRTHERVLFAFYLLAGLAVTRGVKDKLLGQSTIALVWLTFSLAISFMEAWVKFKAPLLRKYVAVDVGRHVFSAQHAVEFGLATAFWIPGQVSGQSAIYYPAMVSTAMYLVLALFVGPLLYFRAKYKMVHEGELLTTEESSALDEISKEIQGKQLPNARWHVVYVLLDAIKVAGLGLFARSCLMRAG